MTSMATYTPLSPVDVRAILSRYPLGDLVSLEALPGGQANSSFKLKTEQGTFVLSICDEKPLSQVVTLCQVLDLLQASNFPTQRVIKTHSAEGVITVNAKPVFIKTYIPGQVPEQVTSGMLVQVGRQLARLHQIQAPDGIPRRFAYGLECFDEVLNSRQSAEYRRWLADKQAYLTESLSAELPRCMIHGDLFYDNTLFAGQELKAILDFEEVCVYFRAFDIGMCLAGFCILD
ncbi:MAG: phosphotransferase, partial [Desulfobacterales bacterium]